MRLAHHADGGGARQPPPLAKEKDSIGTGPMDQVLRDYAASAGPGSSSMFSVKSFASASPAAGW
jgi:hypothetical protein